MEKRKADSQPDGTQSGPVKPQRDAGAPGPDQVPVFIPFGFMQDMAPPPRPPERTDLRCTRNGGRSVWRQASAVNEFNPDGISLAAIDMEIRVAAVKHHPPLHLQDDVTRLAIQPADADIRYAPATYPAYTLKEADRWAVQDGDAGLAELARAHPVALIDCPVIQFAIARWVYASWNSGDPKLKKVAEGLLARARTPMRGRRRQHEYVPALLRQAYDDLVVYGTLLRKCHKRMTANDELIRWFPDCNRLHAAGMLVLDEQYIRRHGFPSPATVAVSYLAHRTGMSPALIHQLVDNVAQA
jgi:hypothetical protein